MSIMHLHYLILICALAALTKSNDDGNHKRLVLHSEGDMASEVQSLKVLIADIQANLSATQQDLIATKQELTETKRSHATQGSTFVRWGRTVCSNNTETVYQGFAAGSRFTESGAAADYICLAREPLWGNFDDNNNPVAAHLYGAEYEFAGFFGQNLEDHDSPCCVCRSNLPTTVMIPGRNQCYPGWTEQYTGYLVGGYPGHVAASNFACLDSRPEAELGDFKNEDGKLMYIVEGVCGSLKCPPYIQGREITCVVCSK